MKRFWRLILVQVVVAIGLLVVAEGVARVAIGFNPGYYASIDARGSDVHYPYGVIHVNSLGHPDEEWDLKDPRPRVAYVGDSINYGVGAGFGYRYSDILEKRYPQFQHLTLASVGSGFTSRKRIDQLAETVQGLGVNLVIYFMNLNDVLPSRETAEAAPQIVPAGTSGGFFKELYALPWKYADQLRSASALFSLTAFRVRIVLQQFGWDFSGMPAYELYPTRNADIVRGTAEHLNYFKHKMESIGIKFALVLLPYEMQVSADAARTYAGYGIEWEDDFVQGATQAMIRENLEPDLRAYDARQAFLGGPFNRDTIKVGQLFVYNRGDKLDWNHPNRDGHRLIADFLEREGVLNAIAAAPQTSTK